MPKKSEEVLSLHMVDHGTVAKASNKLKLEYVDEVIPKCLNVHRYHDEFEVWLHSQRIYVSNEGSCRMYHMPDHDEGIEPAYALGGLYYDFVIIMRLLGKRAYYECGK